MYILIALLIIVQLSYGELASVSFGNKPSSCFSRHARVGVSMMAVMSFIMMALGGEPWRLVEFATLSFIAINWNWMHHRLRCKFAQFARINPLG